MNHIDKNFENLMQLVESIQGNDRDVDMVGEQPTNNMIRNIDITVGVIYV